MLHLAAPTRSRLTVRRLPAFTGRVGLCVPLFWRAGIDVGREPKWRGGLMTRPKTDVVIGLRIAHELLADLDAEADRRRMTRSDWLKDTIEHRLAIMWSLRANWYQLRTLDLGAPRLHGATGSDAEQQEAGPGPIRGTVGGARP